MIRRAPTANTKQMIASSGSGFVDVEGSRIHYRLDGNKGLPALVLSNSLGTDLSLWEPQIPALASSFCIVRYDGRGHGKSRPSTGEYKIDRLAKDLIAVLDHLGIQTTAFCGLSLGGMVGLWLGINAPTRVRKLAICSTAAKIGSQETWKARIDSVRKGGMAAVTESILERWFTAWFAKREPAAVERIRQMLLASPPEGYVANCAAVRDADFREDVSGIVVPTLVISGKHDRSTPPADGRYLIERIAGAKYSELDAAHLSNVECAQQFAAEVLRFLTA